MATHIRMATCMLYQRFGLRPTRIENIKTYTTPGDISHQPAGGAGGQATDIAIQATQLLRIRERIARVIATQTGQQFEKVARDIERDYWMKSDEAMAYGIVSRIVKHQSELACLSDAETV